MIDYAKVIADSVSPSGERLTTFVVNIWRPILAEFNTHRALSRSSASSRARPVTKILEEFTESDAGPVSWPAEKPGMSGGVELEGSDLLDAQLLFGNARSAVASLVNEYVDSRNKDGRLHKSVLNRLLEFGLWQTIIVSATDWDNFFWLRCAEDAQPEFRVVALAMRYAYEQSVPVMVDAGGWHLPLWAENGGHESDWVDAGLLGDPVEIAKACSVARCARVSYMTHEGVRDLNKDVVLFERLKEDQHLSPFEHVASPWETNIQSIDVYGKMRTVPLLGNFVGWEQLRLSVE